MAIDPEDAAQSLSAVARTERRTREAVRYSALGLHCIMWGVLVGAGNLAEHLLSPLVYPVWIAVMLAGVAGGFVIHAVRSRGLRGAPGDRRLLYALVLLVAFGFLWAYLLHPSDAHRLGAYWPTLFMFGFIVAGLWIGRPFVVYGVVVTAMVVAGTLWPSSWLHALAQLALSAGMIAGGLWLRRIGVPR